MAGSLSDRQCISGLTNTPSLSGGWENPVVVEISLPGRKVFAKAWEVRIGITRLLLMDTDLAENAVEDRRITYQLYGGDHEMRIQQEIVLGLVASVPWPPWVWLRASFT